MLRFGISKRWAGLVSVPVRFGSDSNRIMVWSNLTPLEKLASVPCGGGGAVAVAATAGGSGGASAAPAAAEPKTDTKVEEKEESDDVSVTFYDLTAEFLMFSPFWLETPWV
ncbi:hypothetical protein B296_00029645 [Ensete ventricosum]|uniref:Uncharacterized protein n=1 Tax=Ensete ventricosum TaxID=4639 RepID=A0A427AKL0_ENSVE|nr:hypothetical protein B296_00029645 [Ensete ventricosum]